MKTLTFGVSSKIRIGQKEKIHNTLFIFSQNILSSSARKLIPSFICFYLWGYIKVIKSMKSFCAFAERSKGIFIFSITRHTKNSVKTYFLIKNVIFPFFSCILYFCARVVKTYVRYTTLISYLWKLHSSLKLIKPLAYLRNISRFSFIIFPILNCR